MVAQVRMRDAGGTLRTITRIRMRDAAGTLRTIQRIRMRDPSGTLRTVFLYYSVTVDSTYIYAHRATAGSLTTGAVTATAVGGSGGLTYLWEAIAGGGGITIDTPNAASTTFTSNAAITPLSRGGSYRCKVTDGLGEIIYTETVQVDMEWGT